MTKDDLMTPDKFFSMMERIKHTQDKPLSDHTAKDITNNPCTKCGNRDNVCQCILCVPKIT